MNSKKIRGSRRGVIAVLSAVLLVVLLGMVAFAVDVGYLSLARTQLQTAADSAALAAASLTNHTDEDLRQEAQKFANLNTVAGRPIQLNADDIQFGTWDASDRSFTPTESASNAVRVTVRTSPDSGGSTPLFFAKVLGRHTQQQSASAIATVNPRDICFVVDLSRSMNFDTNPGESSSSSALIQNVYDDFGFGAQPGIAQYAGQSLGLSKSSYWSTQLTNIKTKLGEDAYKTSPYYTGKRVTINWNTYYLDADGVTYLSDSTRTKRALSWVIEVQLAALMPNAAPALDADISANYNYWTYDGYGSGDFSQDGFIPCYWDKLGYLSYMTFMMNKARDYTVANGYHTPLSLESELSPCPEHDETVTGELFRFPPREMPTHAARRALIAAIQVVRDRNNSVSDVMQKDWVSIITYDSVSSRAVKWSLANRDNYSGAMQVCTRFQAYGGTGTEAGLNMAYEHIKPQSQGGLGRENANKVVVLLTDGMPNEKRSTVTSTIINNYIANNSSVWTNPSTGSTVNNWVTTGLNVTEKNAALMQTSQMQGDKWYVFAAGIGRGCDYDFMDRVARMGATANPDGQCPRGSDDPTVYEEVLRQIFENIITNPKLRLVQ